jgi:hypothetical protein
MTDILVKGYDISFLITNFHTEVMLRHKLVDFVIHFMEVRPLFTMGYQCAAVFGSMWIWIQHFSSIRILICIRILINRQASSEGRPSYRRSLQALKREHLAL